MRNPLIWTRDADDLEAVSGAYVLLLQLRSAVVLPPRFGRKLAPGVYAYVGSARGSGGLRARCRRHLRRQKIQRWHIDWLSGCAGDVVVAGFPNAGAGECDLFDVLVACGATVPIPGLGSSDCRRCPSHLAGFEMSWSQAARDDLLNRVQLATNL